MEILLIHTHFLFTTHEWYTTRRCNKLL